MKNEPDARPGATREGSSDHAARQAGVYPWLGLVCILLLYAFLVARIHPTNFFGLTEDDSIYFSSAKALAEGQGYILPSVPGTPPATKYPILYPWILSWIWRWNPSFPANLTIATGINGVFGFAFLTLAFLFLRNMKGLNDAGALLLTAFCAAHPLVHFYTANLVADIPFAAATLAAIVLAARSAKENRGMATAILSGVLSGLATLLRILGAPVAAGLFLAMLLRGGWRRAMAFAAGVAPFFIAMFWRSIVSVPQVAPNHAAACADSWQNTWLYYTNYPAFWKVASIDHHTFWQNVQANFVECLLQPGAYFVESQFIRPSMLALVLAVALSVVTARGLMRHVRAEGWHPIYFALSLYLLPVLIWDYTTVDRFLIPFLPLLAGGIGLEGAHLVRQIADILRKRGTPGEKAAAGFFCVAGATVLLAACVSWRREESLFRRESADRAALMLEKREAYEWLRQSSSPEARFIAYEDASAYLYSGRQGMRPATFLPAGAYRSEVLKADLACLTSSGGPIGAKYWITAEDDFGFEWELATRAARFKETEMESLQSLVFRSRAGHVRIYELVPTGK
jgi:hypothetical protein